MYDAGIQPDSSSYWTECASVRAWARSDLAFEPIPSFGSSVRTRLQQSIADDEAEISELRDSIRRVDLKLQELQRRVGRNRARLAPIRLIPNETLSDIFLKWRDLHYGLMHYSREYFTPPSTIMKICRRWTACAISTPGIWVHGKYRLDTRQITKHDLKSLYKTYFDRSGAHSINAEFDGQAGGFEVDSIWREVMEPSLVRMKSLEIFGRSSNTDPAVGALNDWPDRNLVTSLNICTRLSYLCLWGIEFPDSEGQIPILLPTLRTIRYVQCEGNPPIRCPDLVTCEFEECKLMHSYACSLCVSSPLLEKLSFYMTYIDAGRMFPRPTFLALKHLEIGLQESQFPDCFSNGPSICRLDIDLSLDFSLVLQHISLGSYSALTALTLNMSTDMVALEDANVRSIHDWMAQARNLAEFQLIFDPQEDGCYEEHGMNMYIDPLLGAKRESVIFPHLKRMTIQGELGLEASLLQLLVDRAPDTVREEAGYLAHVTSQGIVQRPCLLTLVHSCSLPDMNSVGLREFLEIRSRQAAQKDDDETIKIAG